MIILYIPFERSNCGDLGKGAQIWKNNYSLHTSEKINIIYYNDDFDRDEIELSSTVYILAHGATNNPNILLNCANSDQAILINIDTLATRFEFDFLNIIRHILEIHLYFCGEQQKNWLIAKQFKNLLLSADHAQVYFYQGKLYTPDKQGRFLTEENQKISPATLFNLPISEGREINPQPGHLSIKQSTIQTYDEFIEQSIQKASDKIKKRRYDAISSFRSQQYTPSHIIQDESNLVRRQRFFHPNQPAIAPKIAEKPCLTI